MFENRTYKETIVIYFIIAFIVTMIIASVHYLQGFHPYYIIIAANVEFFCVFYFMYLPLKYHRKKWYRITVFPFFVTEYNPKIIDIRTLDNAKKEIKDIGSDPQSIDIMAPKAISKVIKLENVVLQDAIIIKQDMLSVGGEVAVPKNTFDLHKEKGSILVIGTIKQLNDLVLKLKRHYSRLKNIAEELDVILKDVKWKS